MGISLLRATGRLLLPIAAVVLSAGFAASAHAGDRGSLRLQLGSLSSGDHVPNRIVYQADDGSVVAGIAQTIGATGKCTLKFGGDSLLAIAAVGGQGELGLGPDSIGVFDGPKGVACYRVSAGAGEALTFGLGADLLSMTGANAFDQLEVDVEVKGDAELRLTVYIGSVPSAVYLLRTGARIVPGQGSNIPGSEIFNCNARSDSGPDSGAGDNCRWVIPELGQSFSIVPMSGEFSLEGGGDWGTDAFVNNTVVHLVDVVAGSLGCGNPAVPEDENTQTIGDGITDAQCAVTRIDPTGIGGSCTQAVGYIFRNLPGSSAEGCELLKSPGEQLAASIDITFPPEPRTALGQEPKTEIEFSDGVGGFVPFTPERCDGTVVEDPNRNRTIKEVLSVTGFAPDVVPGTSAKEWACILDSQVSYLGPASNPLMQVRQTILFWGDISFSRGGSN